MASLYLPETPEAEGILEIYDCTGRQVYSQKLELEEGAQSIPVDMSNHLPGMYTARLELGGQVRTERLVVVK